MVYYNSWVMFIWYSVVVVVVLPVVVIIVPQSVERSVVEAAMITTTTTTTTPFFLFITNHSRNLKFHVTNDVPTSISTTGSSTASFLMMGLRGKRKRSRIREYKKTLKTPPFIKTPYGNVREPSVDAVTGSNNIKKICTSCQGRGIKRCHVCHGRGIIRSSGINRNKNQIPGGWSKVIGSKWTSVEQRCGHRQYTVTQTKGTRSKKNVEILMSNCCGPDEKRVHIWITLDELRSKDIWKSGWTTLNDIRTSNQINEGKLIDAKVCFLCKGQRICTCDECNGTGHIELPTILFD